MSSVLEHESIFDGVFGCEVVLAADAIEADHDWSRDDFMIRFEAGNAKAGQKFLNRVFADTRVSNLRRFSLQYEKKPTFRQIVAFKDRLPNLRYIYFSGPRNWNHFDFFRLFRVFLGCMPRGLPGRLTR